MRTARIKADGGGYYHVMSRVIERRMAFGDLEKEKLRQIMRLTADFCGVQVLTYALMSNHFHLLVKVPERGEISDEELVRRLALLYPKPMVSEIERQLCEARAGGDEGLVEAIRSKYLYRMGEVSEFMKTLKQRFSMWFNKRTKRRGTLWEERFKSVLVEPTARALGTVSAYIDLNAVRAGLVADPKDYRYCGYGEAVGGVRRAREGLRAVMGEEGQRGWSEVGQAYRMMLYRDGERTEKRSGFSSEEVERVVSAGGKLPLSVALRCRVRYFSDGVVLGSKGFVEEVFERHRGEFGLKRQTGARAMRWGEWGGLCTMRDLRLQVIHAGTA